MEYGRSYATSEVGAFQLAVSQMLKGSSIPPRSEMKTSPTFQSGCSGLSYVACSNVDLDTKCIQMPADTLTLQPGA